MAEQSNNFFRLLIGEKQPEIGAISLEPVDLRLELGKMLLENADFGLEFVVFKGEIVEFKGELLDFEGEFRDLQGEFRDLQGEFCDFTPQNGGFWLKTTDLDAKLAPDAKKSSTHSQFLPQYQLSRNSFLLMSLMTDFLFLPALLYFRCVEIRKPLTRAQCS